MVEDNHQRNALATCTITVICTLSPVMTHTCNHFWVKGISVSSQVNICPGQYARPFVSIVCCNKSKYALMTLVAPNTLRTKEQGPSTQIADTKK